MIFKGILEVLTIRYLRGGGREGRAIFFCMIFFQAKSFAGTETPNKFCSNDRLCKFQRHNLRLTEMEKTLMVGAQATQTYNEKLAKCRPL